MYGQDPHRIDSAAACIFFFQNPIEEGVGGCGRCRALGEVRPASNAYLEPFTPPFFSSLLHVGLALASRDALLRCAPKPLPRSADAL